MKEPSRPSERDMMGGIQKPDLSCDEHGDVLRMVREILKLKEDQSCQEDE